MKTINGWEQRAQAISCLENQSGQEQLPFIFTAPKCNTIAYSIIGPAALVVPPGV
jgi:hypothetical protein